MRIEVRDNYTRVIIFESEYDKLAAHQEIDIELFICTFDTFDTLIFSAVLEQMSDAYEIVNEYLDSIGVIASMPVYQSIVPDSSQ
jgi:hypothetical protein